MNFGMFLKKKFLFYFLLLFLIAFLFIVPKLLKFFTIYSTLKVIKLDTELIEQLNLGFIKGSYKKDFKNHRVLNTTCNEEVTKLGFHQKVVSYSFLNKNPGYWKGLNHVMQNVSTFYPGWTVRIYASSPDILFLKSFMKNWTFVYFCDIDNLPPPIYSVRPYPVTMWRFVPLIDEQVDIFMSRDLDSEILQREYDAVSEWLNSTTKSLHIMRDHPFHKFQILGGMWGMRKKDSKKERLRLVMDKMFKKAVNYSSTAIDQTLLQKILWPEFKNDFIAHDSYMCLTYPRSSPFPTRRYGLKFIGAQLFRKSKVTKLKDKCPFMCRPKNHLDWEYC